AAHPVEQAGHPVEDRGYSGNRTPHGRDRLADVDELFELEVQAEQVAALGGLPALRDDLRDERQVVLRELPRNLFVQGGEQHGSPPRYGSLRPIRCKARPRSSMIGLPFNRYVET